MFLLLALALWGTVSRPVTDMYSEPSVDAEVVSQAIYGTNVELIDEKDGWVKVRTPDRYAGWTPVPALLRNEKPYAATGRVAEVTSLFANLYREPSATKHAPLMTVPFETRLELFAGSEGDQGRWLEVRLVDGRRAWVDRGDVAFNAKPLSIGETIALAKRFLGLPYLWGGVSSYGFDCSGFTQMLCRKRGVLIPRDSQVQAGWAGMIPVERDALKPGDLVFFGRSRRAITHTGVYLGNGEMIHATPPYIRLSRLDDEARQRGFIAARRVGVEYIRPVQ